MYSTPYLLLLTILVAHGISQLFYGPERSAQAAKCLVQRRVVRLMVGLKYRDNCKYEIEAADCAKSACV
ncbi:unnamed protein product [Acanthoscelides obtectus]|uniref:Uncharacterized protein n=1 Tax=Acanthoscelides obtectus TaxID=200917 RepID=A0A9P0JY43_ACAOB|nr:unnamed protein product [Acanthoscelides obtectus]CAK1663978.1 hypothetical protein AOBTE_LOCUS23974 [Acanthoscelides obtectus]